MTPYQIWFKHQPDLFHLKIFGCKACALIHKEKRQKLNAHSIKCTFSRYNENPRHTDL